jgi:hypothetical protein
MSDKQFDVNQIWHDWFMSDAFLIVCEQTLVFQVRDP